jgi:hypothetical protein
LGISRQSREIFTTGDRASRRAALHLMALAVRCRLCFLAVIALGTTFDSARNRQGSVDFIRHELADWATLATQVGDRLEAGRLR